ncbi:hypothetical protein EIO_1320 [Ketogulonicigenium vulgare Y25]|nr:hypothetical protein EIO_1320 [Ketogulonicigenium vulgare Y25]AOZ54369.1 hypothetical protein KVC_1354 [Ketogulonicigenium vulgare]
MADAPMIIDPIAKIAALWFLTRQGPRARFRQHRISARQPFVPFTEAADDADDYRPNS